MADEQESVLEDAPRSSALRAARERRMREWFGDRRWRVCTELSYAHEDVVVKAGELWIQNGKVFRTPFGNKGTHGYILQEVDPKTGTDVWKPDRSGPVQATFGWITIKNASDMFPGSIVEVPPRPYGQRGGVAALEHKRD